MGAIQRQRIQWTGFPGAPGVTTMYFLDAAAAQTAVGTLVANFAALVPPNVKMQPEATGDIIESTTGAITGTWVGTQGVLQAGVGSATYAAPVGIQLQWLTGAVRAGRRVRGKTFIVPASIGNFTADGTLIDTVVTDVAAVGAAFVASTVGNFLVWARPRAATPSWTDVHGIVHPAKSAAVGGGFPVVGGRVPDKAVVLRSRRD